MQHLAVSSPDFLICSESSLIQFSHTAPCDTSKPHYHCSKHTNFKSHKVKYSRLQSQSSSSPLFVHLPKYRLHLTTPSSSLSTSESTFTFTHTERSTHTHTRAHVHTHTPHSSLSSPHCKSLYLFLASLGWLPTCRVAHAGLELQFFLPLLLKYCGWVPLTCSPLNSIKYTCLPSRPCFLVCIGNGKQRRHEWEKTKRPGWGNLASNETYS